MSTGGPGATNLVTAIADAYMDSCPLIAITGQVTTNMIGRNAFQETDIIGVTLPIVKHSYLRNGCERHSTHHQGSVLHRAKRTARSGDD